LNSRGQNALSNSTPQNSNILTAGTGGSGDIGYPLYNAPPKDPGYPYVEYQEVTETAGGGKKCPNPTIPIIFHIWDSAGSMGDPPSELRSAEIAQAIIDGLTVSVDSATNYITVPNFNVIWQKYEDFMTVPNVSENIIHGVLRIEFSLQEVL
jgi:hypothetical protein